MTKRQHDFRINILNPALRRLAPGTVFTLRSLIMETCHRRSPLVNPCAWYGTELIRIALSDPNAGFVQISADPCVFRKL